MRPDENWLRENYELFLSEYFSGGRMPANITLLTSTRLRGTWGWAGWRGAYRWRRAYDTEDGVNGLESKEMGWGPGLDGSHIHRNSKGQVLIAPENASYTIKIKNVDFLPECIYEDTLIHEMCHIFCYCNKLWTGEGHDGYFLRLSEYIKRKSNGNYDITRYVKKEHQEMADKVSRALGAGSPAAPDGERGAARSFIVAVTLGDVVFDPDTDAATSTLWFNAGTSLDAAKALAMRMSGGGLRPMFNAYDYEMYISDTDVDGAAVYATGEEWIRRRCSSPRNCRVTSRTVRNWEILTRSINRLLSNGAIEQAWDPDDDSGAEPGAPDAARDPEPAPAAPEPEPEPMPGPEPEPEPSGSAWNPSDGSPMDRLRSLPKDEGIRTFRAFRDWYTGLGYDERMRLNDIRMQSPELGEQDWWLGWFLRNEFHGLSESSDYTDEQKLAMLTEGILGRAYDRARRWLDGLADRVMSSLFGREQVRFTGEYDEDGNEIVEVGIP